MKKYTIMGGVMTLAIVFTLTLAASTYASSSDSENGSGQRPEVTEGMRGAHKQINEAIANGDYDSYLALIAEMPNGEEKVADMTEEKFNEMTAEYAEREEIKKIHEALQDAILNNDYETWKVLHSELSNGSEMLSIIDTEEEFNQLVSAQLLINEGRAKIEEARKMMDELGLEKSQMREGKRTVMRGKKMEQGE